VEDAQRTGDTGADQGNIGSAHIGKGLTPPT
jgi:hypothetical protein